MVKIDNQSSNESHKIEAKERFSNLNTKWHQNSKVRTVAGAILLTLGAILATATVAAALFFVATPAVVIGVVAGLATTSLITLISGIVFLTLPSSWNCPHYRLKRHDQAMEDINENNLSYKEIRIKYGELIDSYDILNKEDINKIVKSDIASKSYTEIMDRHGKGIISILDSTNQAILKKKFLEMLMSKDTFHFNNFKNDYGDAATGLRVTAEDLRPIFERDIKTLPFQELIDRHGSDWLTSPYRIIATEEMKETLKNKALNDLQGLDIGFNKTKEKYQKACQNIGVDIDTLMKDFAVRDLEQMKQKTMDYKAFRSRNPFEALDTLDESQKEEVKTHFKSYAKSSDVGFEELQNEYLQEIKFFRIDTFQLVFEKAPEDIEKLTRREISFKDFHAKHGKVALKTILTFGRIEWKDLLINRWEEHLLQFEKGGLIALNRRCIDDDVHGEVATSAREAMIKRELNKLTSEQLSYEQYRLRNGLDNFDELKKRQQATIQEAFLRQGYQTLIRRDMSQDIVRIGLTEQQVRKTINKKVIDEIIKNPETFIATPFTQEFKKWVDISIENVIYKAQLEDQKAKAECQTNLMNAAEIRDRGLKAHESFREQAKGQTEQLYPILNVKGQLDITKAQKGELESQIESKRKEKVKLKREIKASERTIENLKQRVLELRNEARKLTPNERRALETRIKDIDVQVTQKQHILSQLSTQNVQGLAGAGQNYAQQRGVRDFIGTLNKQKQDILNTLAVEQRLSDQMYTLRSKQQRHERLTNSYRASNHKAQIRSLKDRLAVTTVDLERLTQAYKQIQADRNDYLTRVETQYQRSVQEIQQKYKDRCRDIENALKQQQKMICKTLRKNVMDLC